MTKEDALLHFPHEAEDDLEELFEDRLFEFKQKLLVVSPSRKLYDIHLKRFKKVSDAFLFLVNESEVESSISIDLKSFDENLSQSWKDFNDNKNRLKLLLSNAATLNDIVAVLNLMLANMIDYSVLFEELKLEGSIEEMTVNKEPDAMEVTAAIQGFNRRGFHSISEIIELESDNMLYQEAIRLSLWYKKEKHVG